VYAVRVRNLFCCENAPRRLDYWRKTTLAESSMLASHPVDSRVRRRAGGVLVLGLVLLGLVLRLPGLPLVGTGDMHVWKVWARAAATHGFTEAYPIANRADWPPLTLDTVAQVRAGQIRPGAYTHNRVTAPTDYPPGTILVLWGVGKVYQTVIRPDFADNPTFHALIKLVVVLGDALAAVLIAWAVRRWVGSPGGIRRAAVAGLAYWCNPTVIVAGSVLGYLDALLVLPLLALLVALTGRRYATGWVAWGVAFMVKLQALFVGPALALLSLRRGPVRLLGYGAAALGTIGLFCAPFLLKGTFVGVLAGIGNNAQEGYLSANQVNLWWVWSYFWEWHAEGKGPGVLVRIVPVSVVSEAHIADLNAWAIGLFAVFLLGTSAVWAWGSRGRASSALRVTDLFLVPLQFYGATMLLPSIHENHLLPVLALVALLAGLAAARGARRMAHRLAFLYLALSIIVGLNLVLFYGFGRGAIAPVPRMWFGADASVLLAALNVVLFVVTLAVWSVVHVRTGRAGTAALATAGAIHEEQPNIVRSA
jgi:hypothetical protein